MKRHLFIPVLAASVLMISSCGAQRVAVETEEDVIDIGYEKVLARDKTSATTRVKPNKKEAVVYTNMLDYLRGRVPGLNVSPDGSITIRGINTINGDPTPLFVVDGVTVPSIDYINPNDVASVDVIKDGASAIYGVRGGNGVIIINMKK